MIVARPLKFPCRMWAASAAAKVYGKLAQAVVQEVRNLKEKADTTPEIVFDPSSKEFVINSSQRMSAIELRYGSTAREAERQSCNADMYHLLEFIRCG
jgi:DNA-directed RNA polymerase